MRAWMVTKDDDGVDARQRAVRQQQLGGSLVGALTAEGISFLGTRVSMIAIPWFVLSTTGSATQTGLVAAVEIIGTALKSRAPGMKCPGTSMWVPECSPNVHRCA